MNHLANHLWQSTVFAAAVALATLFLRRNSARLRYWLWLAASLKFLVPFSLLTTLGAGIARPSAAPIVSARAAVQAESYLEPAPTFPVVMSAATSYRRFAFAAVWAAGALFLVCRWRRRWCAIRDLARSARPIAVHPSLAALAACTSVEPGVFGIFHPVLLLPEGMPENLTLDQFSAVLSHELCHVRYRDNLTAALHMCVEALFWFHPLVWWIGARLIQERESACDEAVLLEGSRPADYAQGIVNVCRTYRETPLACVSAISGADLKQRIRGIMSWRGAIRLTVVRKSILASSALAAITAPLAIGFLRAQTLPPAPAYTYEVVSIHKSSAHNQNSSLGPGANGGLRSQNTTVMQLLTFAYKVRDYQISGAPGWVTSDRFDVSFTPEKTEAAPAPGTPPKQIDAFINRNQQRMQAVLRDRFGLVLRAETHELPIYALVPAKGGLKLTPSAHPEQGPALRGGPGKLTGIGATLRALAGVLSDILGRPVVEPTGSDAQYDFELLYTPEKPTPPNEAPPPPDTPSIFTAVTEQLGLRLESKKGPVQVYVIEKIEKPSEN